MSLLVDFAQTCRADVRVNLRGHEALVTQQFLHGANVGSAIEQVRCEAMSQSMRRSTSIQSGFQNLLVQHPGHAASRQPISEFVREDRCRSVGWGATGESADLEPFS